MRGKKKKNIHSMQPDELMNRALEIALRVHGEQRDRYGAPYIFHPFRVMIRVNSNSEKIAALLHDTVEDGEITLDDLRREGFSEEILESVDCLSRREGESYGSYMDRVMANPLAVTVKIADLEDNMDLRRLPEIGPEDVKRLIRYHGYWRRLTGK
jgi:(p)ppGpp synthase/HD superfamily hydrolase